MSETKTIIGTAADIQEGDLVTWPMSTRDGRVFEIEEVDEPPAVEITEQSLIPADYYVNKPQIDKAKIKDALKNGGSVAGAMLVQRTSLRVE